MATPDTPCLHCGRAVMRSLESGELLSFAWYGGILTASCSASETGHAL